MKWLDTRLHKPSPSRFDKYIVTYETCGIVSIGLGSYMPKNSYTDGDWVEINCMNGNLVLGAQVLYWMPHPKIPSLEQK